MTSNGVVERLRRLKPEFRLRHRGLTATVTALVCSAAALVSPAGAQGAELELPSLESFSPEIRSDILDRRQALDGRTGREGAEAWGSLGRVLQVHALFAEARVCFENAAAMDPSDGRWDYALALLAIEQADLDEALQHLESTRSSSPGYWPAGLRRATILLELGRVEEAAGILEEVEALAPGTAAVHCARGRVAESRGDLEQAVLEYETCLELQPDARRVHARLAPLYRRLGDPAASQRHAQSWGAADVTWPDPWLAQLQSAQNPAALQLAHANRALTEGRLEEADEHYRQAIGLDPDSFDARTGYATLLDRRGETGASIAEWRRAVELRPDDPLSQFNLGSLLAREGSYGEAEPHFRAALRLDPSDRETLDRLVYSLERLDRRDEIPDLYSTMLRSDPNDADLRMQYGTHLMRIGRPSAAAEQFEQVVLLGRNTPSVYQAWATALALDGRWTGAREALTSGLASNPGELTLTHSMALLALQASDPAVRNPEQALGLALDVYQRDRSARHLETLAEALAATGDYPEAIRAQTALVEEAQRRGDDAWLERATATLERYEKAASEASAAARELPMTLGPGRREEISCEAAGGLDP